MHADRHASSPLVADPRNQHNLRIRSISWDPRGCADTRPRRCRTTLPNRAESAWKLRVRQGLSTTAASMCRRQEGKPWRTRESSSGSRSKAGRTSPLPCRLHSLRWTAVPTSRRFNGAKYKFEHDCLNRRCDWVKSLPHADRAARFYDWEDNIERSDGRGCESAWSRSSKAKMSSRTKHVKSW